MPDLDGAELCGEHDWNDHDIERQAVKHRGQYIY